MNSVATDWYADRLAQVKSKPNPTEADISDSLVRPVLEKVLKFSVSEIDAQPTNPETGRKDRPDFVCRRNASGTASAIVEVKRLGIDLMKRSGDSWSTSPLGQLQNYMNRFRGSAEGTWGILTNGSEWLITRREDSHVSPFADIPQPSKVETLIEVQKILADVQTKEFFQKKDFVGPVIIDWLDVISGCDTPAEFIRKVATPPPPPPPP